MKSILTLSALMLSLSMMGCAHLRPVIALYAETPRDTMAPGRLETSRIEYQFDALSRSGQLAAR